MRNPAKQLDHAKKEPVAATYYNISASAVEETTQRRKESQEH